MEKDNDLLEKQIENDEDLLDFDLDDLTEIELDEDSPEDGDIIELVDFVEEGEVAVEDIGEEISVLSEEGPARREGETTHVLKDGERPRTADLTDSDVSDEFDSELDMALSDLELTEEPAESELHQEQESIETEIIDEKEVEKDLEALFSDDEFSDEMIEGDLEAVFDDDLSLEDPEAEVTAIEEMGELEEIVREEGLSETTSMEDLEDITGAELSLEEPMEEAAAAEEMGDVEGFESEEEKPWESGIETIQGEKIMEDESIIDEEPLFEETAPPEQVSPATLGLSEEKIEAIVKASVEDVLERVARETMNTIAERIARETMTAVAEKVIGETIEALKRSLEPSID